MSKHNKLLTKEAIIKEINIIVQTIGHFPMQTELLYLERYDILYSIRKNKYTITSIRSEMGYNLLRKQKGYWNEKTIIEELKQLITKIGHFPLIEDLENNNLSGLRGSIQVYGGGLSYYRRKMGFASTIRQLIPLYSRIVGDMAEEIMYSVLNNCSKDNGLELITNKYFSDRRVVEFYIIHKESGATASIDVTRTSCYDSIIKKWSERNYHENSDLLFIVVFSNKLNKEDYDILNNLCPKNVYVIDVKDFIKSFKYDYNNIVEEDINLCINYTFDRYMKETNNGDSIGIKSITRNLRK